MDDKINWFQYFHSYNVLVKEGKAKPFLCSTDGCQLIIENYKNKLALMCYSCDTRTFPGLDLFDRVRAVVKEHNDI